MELQHHDQCERRKRSNSRRNRLKQQRSTTRCIQRDDVVKLSNMTCSAAIPLQHHDQCEQQKQSNSTINMPEYAPGRNIHPATGPSAQLTHTIPVATSTEMNNQIHPSR
jgi:hypothetical protein